MLDKSSRDAVRATFRSSLTGARRRTLLDATVKPEIATATAKLWTDQRAAVAGGTRAGPATVMNCVASNTPWPKGVRSDSR